MSRVSAERGDIMYSSYPALLDYNYGWENMENSRFFPSTAHQADNKLTAFYRKYLFQRALSVFDFTLPENWPVNFFLNSLYGIGFLIVLDTDEFGVTCQFGTIWGYDLYYQPAFASVCNPLFDDLHISRKYEDMRIWDKCALLRLSTDYQGIIGICQYYAELLATAAASLNTNLLNTKLAYVFGAKNKTQAESLKALFDKVASGELAVFPDKSLFDETGKLNVELFNRDIRQTYIGTDLLNDMQTILNRFDSLIGIPNTNYTKRERLITDEVNQNNFETRALCFTWRDMLKQDMSKINQMYGTQLDVEFRKGAGPDNAEQDNDNSADAAV